MASVAFMVALVCPCVSPPARAASGPAHDCCPPEAGSPRVSTPVPAGVSLAALPAVAPSEASGLPHPVFAVPASPVPVRAPLILRI